MKWTVSLLIVIFIYGQTFAQTGGLRYIDEVFDSVSVESNQHYGTNLTVLTFPNIIDDSLLFDIYQPVGDTLDKRPLAVVMHTGTFLPRGLAATTGAKDDSAYVWICTRLARRGYVAVSIEYRTGWNPLSVDGFERRGTYIRAVYRAVQDLHTFLRFVNMTVDDMGDPYRIDADKVAIIGVGTGGIVAQNAAVINEVKEMLIPKFNHPVTGEYYIDTIQLGGITGEDSALLNIVNHPGYKQDFHFVFSLDGAVGDATWLETGTSPPLAFAGNVTHPTIPFGIDLITGQIQCTMPVYVSTQAHFFVLDVAGSACVAEKANALGINDPLNIVDYNDPISNILREEQHAQEHLWAINLPGIQAEPWEYWDSTFWKQVSHPFPDFDNIHDAGIATNPDMSLDKSNAYIDTILWFFSPRACVALGLGECGLNSDVKELTSDEVGFTLAPNPATDGIYISSKDNYPMQRVFIIDMLGKIVHSSNVDHHSLDIDVQGISPGMYILCADFEEGFISEKVLIQRR